MIEKIKKINILKNNWHIILMLVISFFVSMIFYSTTLLNDVYDVEEDTFLFRTIGREIASGKVLYKDIFDHKGPIIYLLNCLFYNFKNINLLYWFSFICTFITIYYVYKICKLRLDNKKSFFVVMIFLGFQLFAPNNGLSFPYDMNESFMMPITAYMYYHFLKDEDFDGKISIITGILTMFVFNMRLNMLSIIFILIFFYLIKKLRKKDYKSVVNFIVRFVVGVVISFSPILGYLIKNDILNDYIFASFIYNIKYSDVSLEQKMDTILNFLYNPYIIIIFVVYIINLIRDMKQKKNFDINFLIFVFCFVMNVCISGRFYGHYLLPIVPMISYPFSNIMSNESIRKIKSKKFEYVCNVVFIFTLIFSIGIICYKMYLNIDNKLYISDIPKDDSDIIKYCNTYPNKNDKVFVLGGNSFKFYWYIDKMPNYPYVYHTVYNEFPSELNKYVNSFEAKYIIVPQDVQYMHNMKEIMTLIIDNYDVCFENKKYTIYRLKS